MNLKRFLAFFIVVSVAVAQTTPICNDRLFNPPRGWDSYDGFPVWSNATGFTEQILLEQAAILASYNATGQFKTLVIDEGWSENDFAWMLDEYGRPTVNPLLFPSSMNGAGLGPLQQTLKQQYGLDLGVWLIKGIPKQAVDLDLPVLGTSYTAKDIYVPGKVCEWHKDVYWVNATHPAGQAYYDSLVQLYASWGLTYLKVDCLFGERDTDPAEVQLLAKSVRMYGSNIALSLSPGKGANLAEGNQIGRLANLYRVTDDLWDCWTQNLVLCPSGTSIINATYTLRDWQPLMMSYQLQTGEISVPDPDMIPLGDIGLGIAGKHLSWVSNEHMGRYIYGMWTITRSPMILGGDMKSVFKYPWLDALYRNVALTEISLCSGQPNVSYFQDVDSSGDHGIIVWTVPHGTIVGGFYSGFFAFSLNSTAAYNESFSMPWSNLPYQSADTLLYSVYDVFAQKSLPEVVAGVKGEFFNVTIPSNDAVMYLLLPFGQQ